MQMSFQYLKLFFSNPYSEVYPSIVTRVVAATGALLSERHAICQGGQANTNLLALAFPTQVSLWNTGQISIWVAIYLLGLLLWLVKFVWILRRATKSYGNVRWDGISETREFWDLGWNVRRNHSTSFSFPSFPWSMSVNPCRQQGHSALQVTAGCAEKHSAEAKSGCRWARGRSEIPCVCLQLRTPKHRFLAWAYLCGVILLVHKYAPLWGAVQRIYPPPGSRCTISFPDIICKMMLEVFLCYRSGDKNGH